MPWPKCHGIVEAKELLSFMAQSLTIIPMKFPEWIKKTEMLANESGWICGPIRPHDWAYYFHEGFSPEGAIAADRKSADDESK